MAINRSGIPTEFLKISHDTTPPTEQTFTAIYILCVENKHKALQIALDQMWTPKIVRKFQFEKRP